jgi:hypothetical protein
MRIDAPIPKETSFKSKKCNGKSHFFQISFDDFYRNKLLALLSLLAGEYTSRYIDIFTISLGVLLQV